MIVPAPVVSMRGAVTPVVQQITDGIIAAPLVVALVVVPHVMCMGAVGATSSRRPCR